MTELQCLLKLMRIRKLPKEAQDLIDLRLEEIETSLSARSISRPAIIPTNTNQAPSMQRIIDEAQKEGLPVVGSAPPVAMPKPAVAIDKETGRPMIATGRGTLGPRKF